MKPRSILVVILLALLVGCHKKPDYLELPDTDQGVHITKGSGLLSEMTLINGQKWQADAATTQSMANMQAILQKAEKEPTLPTEEIGAQLQEQLNALVAACDMKGDSHEALQVYLSALIPRLNSMMLGTAEEQAKARREAVSIINDYSEWFTAPSPQ